jgi:hypothetical protein
MWKNVHITRLSENKNSRLQHHPTTTFARNGQNCWVRCGNELGNPHQTRVSTSHSDYDYGTRFAGKAKPAKIAGPVGFSHRTEYPFLDAHDTAVRFYRCFPPGRLQ